MGEEHSGIPGLDDLEQEGVGDDKGEEGGGREEAGGDDMEEEGVG